VALVAFASGCSSDRRSATGFRLPPDGNVAAGKAAFLEFGCNHCHEVSGLDLPRPTPPPAVPVVLGGTVGRAPTDGYLVTSIIYPSYSLARVPVRDIPSRGESRMPHYADRMTVRQLADLVAFLQDQYTVPPPQPPGPY
jgi:mono/diheme cytochrome c family protein